MCRNRFAPLARCFSRRVLPRLTMSGCVLRSAAIPMRLHMAMCRCWWLRPDCCDTCKIKINVTRRGVCVSRSSGPWACRREERLVDFAVDAIADEVRWATVKEPHRKAQQLNEWRSKPLLLTGN